MFFFLVFVSPQLVRPCLSSSSHFVELFASNPQARDKRMPILSACAQHDSLHGTKHEGLRHQKARFRGLKWHLTITTALLAHPNMFCLRKGQGFELLGAYEMLCVDLPQATPHKHETIAFLKTLSHLRLLHLFGSLFITCSFDLFLYFSSKCYF